MNIFYISTVNKIVTVRTKHTKDFLIKQLEKKGYKYKFPHEGLKTDAENVEFTLL